MNLTSVKTSFGLSGKAAFVGFGSSGTAPIGDDAASSPVAAGDILHAVRMIVLTGSAILNINTGSAATSTTLVPGSAQAITITAAGNVAGTGTFAIPVTVTATGMTTQVVSVSVKGGDTPTIWAAKVRTALAANEVLGPLFTVGGTGTAITLTRKPLFSTEDGLFSAHSAPLAAMTAAIAAGTAAVTVASSTVLAAGAATSGVKVIGGDGKDFEGETLPAMVKLDAWKLRSVISGLTVSQASDPTALPDKTVLLSGESADRFDTPATIAGGNLLTFAATGTGYADIQVILAGRSS